MSALERRSDRSTDPITGFRPADDGTEAPTAVRDAIEEFTAALAADPGKPVDDPRDSLTLEERRTQRDELLGLVKCQREGEELSGVAPRK